MYTWKLSFKILKPNYWAVEQFCSLMFVKNVLLFQKEQENYKTSLEIEEKLISTAFYKLVSSVIIICAELQLVQWGICTPYYVNTNKRKILIK